jgi:hypothetical protein
MLLLARPQDTDSDVETGAWWFWILLVAALWLGVLSGAWGLLTT